MTFNAIQYESSLQLQPLLNTCNRKARESNLACRSLISQSYLLFFLQFLQDYRLEVLSTL